MSKITHFLRQQCHVSHTSLPSPAHQSLDSQIIGSITCTLSILFLDATQNPLPVVRRTEQPISMYVVLNSCYATILFSTKCHYPTLFILFKSLNIAHSLTLMVTACNKILFSLSVTQRTNSNGNTNNEKYIFTA